MKGEELKFKTTIPKDQWFVSWKLFYAHLTQGRGGIEKNILEEELSKNKSQLLHGFGFRQESTGLQESISGWTLPHNTPITEEKKKKLNESNMTIAKLSNILDLDEDTCEKILISYFEFEFVGTADDVTELLSNTSHLDQEQLSSIILYFIHEKSFFMKCWKIILTCVFNKDHLYHNICYKFVQDQNPSTLYTYFLNQLKMNQENVLPSEMHTHSEIFKTLVNQRLNSQVDILSCLIYLLELKPQVEYKDVQCMLSCCKETSFGNNIISVQFMKSAYTKDWKTHVGYMYCLHLIQVILDSNLDWSFHQFHELFEEIKSLNSDQYPVLVPVIYLTWMLFLIRINYINDEEKLLNHSQQVFQLKPWQQLNTILDSEVVTIDEEFENFVAKKISTLVCDTIKHLDLNVLEYENDHFFKLISKLSACDDIIYNDEIKKVISYGLDIFPGKHLSILHLYIPLMSQSKGNCTKFLEDLLSVRYFNWRSVDVPMKTRGDAFYNCSSFCPFEFVQDIVIPEGTLCRQSESGFAYFQWDINIPLWSIMKEELTAYCVAVSNASSFSEEDSTRNMSYLCNSQHGKVPHQKYLLPSLEATQDNLFRNRIISYLKLISIVVKYPSLLDCNMTQILNIVSNMFELNTTYQSVQQCPDLDILTQCIDIARNMYPGVTLLYSQVTDILPKVLPTPDVENVHEILATGRFLNGNLMKRILTNGVMNKEKFQLVTTYLEFLSKMSESEESTNNSAYSNGILFVALEIFPACLTSWIFEHEKQRRQICVSTLTLIVNFLNSYKPSVHRKETCTSADNLKPPTYLSIVRTVVYATLEGEIGSLLLEITSLGETFLLNAFQECPSSATNLPHIIEIVYLAFALLNKVLYLRREIDNVDKEMPTFEGKSLLEVSMDKSRFIQSVISLVHHSLRKHLRVLSIKLLTRIAQNKDIPLNVSSHTAQALWLKPLFSNTECPQFKIALLQLCVQCLQTQATLACSLLNVENIDNKCESLLLFVLNYLKNINNVNDPLHYWVLAIIHTIWKEEMFIVRSVFTQDEDFWSRLCQPLHSSPSCDTNCHLFSPVLNIISTELYWMSSDTEHALYLFVDKFFSNEANLKRWSETCTSVNTCTSQLGLFHQLSISWQEFIIVVCKFRSSVLTDRVKNILLSDVLDAILEHLSCIDSRSDIKQSFHALCNLGLIILNSWEKQTLDDVDKKLKIACHSIVLLANNYDSIPLKSRILLLALVSKLFMCSGASKQSATLVRDTPRFLNALSVVLSQSLYFYENILSEKNIKNKNTQIISVIIPFTIQIQSILGSENSFWINTLLNENIFYKVYQCILLSVKMKFYNDTSSFLLEYLIHCVLGHNYFHYLDKASLLSVIEEMAPESNIDSEDKNYALLKSHNIAYIYTNEEYNVFYSQFINLLIVVLHRCDNNLKKQVFNFIIINYESIICLVKYCGLALTKQNLNFVMSCLNLILEMSNYRILIEEHTSQYFIEIVKNICVCMNTTIDLLEKEDLKIAHKIYPTGAFGEGLHSKLYTSKLKTADNITAYSTELRLVLMNIYSICLTVYNKYNVEFGLVFTCARVGYLPWAIHNIVPHVLIEKKLEPEIPFCDFTIIIRCLRTQLKLIGKHKDNEMLLNKIRTSFEMTLHLLVNHSLLYLLNPYNNVKDKHVLLRDIEVNLAYVIDYVKENNGTTILPFTKHWSKSPRKYFTQNKLKMPNIKLKLRKVNHILTWGDAQERKNCVQRFLFDEEVEDSVLENGVDYEIKPDMEYMQFMVQLFSQICSLASNTM